MARFDFMGASKWFFSLSGVILLIGALAIGGKGLNFGIDFESGTRIKTALDKTANEDEVRDVLAPPGFGDAEIQQINDKELGGNGFQISTETLDAGAGQRGRAGAATSSSARGSRTASRSIGPTFGKTVAKSAIIAIIASLIVISAYIALRFEWKYAVPVLIALMHDLLITAGVYALTGREVTTSTVAALLTILGYSLYDTIIVFDRVRENVPRMPRAAFSQIVNRSMSEVLTRSLATSLLHAAADPRAAVVRRRDAEGLRVRAARRHRLGRVLVDLHRLARCSRTGRSARRVYARRRARIARASTAASCRPTRRAAGGAGVDVEPERSRRRRARRLTAPDEPGQAVSAATSSQEMVASDLASARHAARRAGGDGRGAADAASRSASATARPHAGGPRAQGRRAEARRSRKRAAQQAPREAR